MKAQFLLAAFLFSEESFAQQVEKIPEAGKKLGAVPDN
jgi:hypothetical protein